MTKIHWSFSNKDFLLHSLAVIDPVLAYPEIVKNRGFHKDSRNYVQCPAMRDFCKNLYVIKSPFDVTLSFDSENNWINVENQSQEFYDIAIANRCSVRASSNAPMVMSLNFQYLFVADKTCYVEVFSPYMHLNNPLTNVRFIPGTFDISKWFRPVEPCFEIIDPSKKIKINRGDPLMYVKFVPKEDKQVELTYKTMTDEMQFEFNKCTYLKLYLKNLPLNTLYELAKRINKKVFGFKK